MPLIMVNPLYLKAKAKVNKLILNKNMLGIKQGKTLQTWVLPYF